MNTHIAQRLVEKADPPASGYYILFDDKIEGFGLRVTAAGAKSFVYTTASTAARSGAALSASGRDGLRTRRATK